MSPFRSFRRRGFTLVELLVSMAIFSVVGTAFATILYTATELMRQGESVRAASDEAVAVISTLEDDLARMVPIRYVLDPATGNGVAPATDGGYLHHEATGIAGSSVLVLLVEDADSGTVGTITQASGWQGDYGRSLVVWWLNQPDPAEPLSGQLMRKRIKLQLGDNAAWAQARAIVQAPNAATGGEVIATGCLHFGAWIATRQQATTAAGSDAFAQATQSFDSDTAGNDPAVSLRTTVVLAGQRFGQRGKLIRDDTSELRLSGIPTLATGAKAMLRVDTEWIGYDDYRRGLVSGLRRGQWRSNEVRHQRDVAVRTGQMWSLVRSLP